MRWSMDLTLWTLNQLLTYNDHHRTYNIHLIPQIKKYLTWPLLTCPIVHPCHCVSPPSIFHCTSSAPSGILHSLHWEIYNPPHPFNYCYHPPTSTIPSNVTQPLLNVLLTLSMSYTKAFLLPLLLQPPFPCILRLLPSYCCSCNFIFILP